MTKVPFKYKQGDLVYHKVDGMYRIGRCYRDKNGTNCYDLVGISANKNKTTWASTVETYYETCTPEDN
jgi:hypothetical protein